MNQSPKSQSRWPLWILGATLLLLLGLAYVYWAEPEPAVWPRPLVRG